MTDDNNSLPSRKREAKGLPPRQPHTTEKTLQQVISEAPLKTNPSDQTNPIVEEQPLEKTKPWMIGQKLSEVELSHGSDIKTFRINQLVLEKLKEVVILRKKKARGAGQKQISDTSIINECLEKCLNAELKKLGYDIKIYEEDE